MPMWLLKCVVCIGIANADTQKMHGNATLKNVRAMAETGVDVISVGALTTRAPWLDLGLDMEG